MFTRRLAIGVAPLILLGCSSAYPSSPQTNDPPWSVVSENDVHEDLDMIVTSDVGELLTFVSAKAKPARMRDATRDEIRREPVGGKTDFHRIDFPGDKAVAFVHRRTRSSMAVVLPKSSAGYVIPPVEWVEAVVRFEGITPESTRAWYQAMSARLATTGHATGVVHFQTEKDWSITLELRTLEDQDIALRASTEEFPAGTLSGDARGPALSVSGVTKLSWNSHEGVSAFDLVTAPDSEFPRHPLPKGVFANDARARAMFEAGSPPMLVRRQSEGH